MIKNIKKNSIDHILTLRCAPSTQTPIRYAATAVNPPPPVPAAAARSPLAPSVLQSHPFGGHDQFTHWRSAAEDNLNSTLAESTRAKGNSSWRHYDSSLGRISGLIDPLFQTIRTLGTTQNNLRRVAATLREGRLDTGLAATNRDRTCPELLIVPTTKTVLLRPIGLASLGAESMANANNSNMFRPCS
jgi:hypothetical protein